MDIFDLYAKLKLDDSEYKSGIKNASNSFDGFEKKIKSGAKKIAVATAAIVATKKIIGTAVDVTKQSIDAYAEYEQLIGGVETLFKTSANAVIKNAQRAYKTAGISANQYMQQVTSFAASLRASFVDTEEGIKAAAKVADMAVQDMADNSAKMGTSLEFIQTAYQGFAKQQYMLLDNLKLGYGGTKTEMERLLSDAQKLSGVKYDITNLADVYEAIHVIQTELDITGTTAKEAEHTISGSLQSAKAAWSNLIAGIADDNADMQTLTTDFINSVGIAADNIVPRIKVALDNIVTTVGNMAPDLGRKVSEIAVKLLPKIGKAMLDFVQVSADVLYDNRYKIVDAAWNIFSEIIGSFIDSGESDGYDFGKKFLSGFGDALSHLHAMIEYDLYKSIYDSTGWKWAQDIANRYAKEINAVYDRTGDGAGRFNGGGGGTTFHSPFTWGGSGVNGNTLPEIYESLKKYNELTEYVEEGYEKQLKAAQDAYDNQYKAARDNISRIIKYSKLGAKEQLRIYERLYADYANDAEKSAEIEDDIFELRAQIWEDFGESATNILEKISDAEKNYRNALENRTKEVYNSYSLFEEVERRQGVSQTRIIRNLEQQVERMTEFYSNLDKLAARGVSTSLVEEIREMGVGANDSLRALLAMSDKALSKYAELYGEKQRFANDQATKELSDLEKQTSDIITNNLGTLKKLYDTNAPYVGEAFSEGLARGIENSMQTVIDAADASAYAAMDSASAVLRSSGINWNTVSFGGADEGSVAGVTNILKEWLPKLANSIIVLDSGTLVGEMISDIDAGLGDLANVGRRTA